MKLHHPKTEDSALMGSVRKNFKIHVFLKKRLWRLFLKVLLDIKKQRFQQFLGQNVQETGRFGAVFIHSEQLGRLI